MIKFCFFKFCSFLLLSFSFCNCFGAEKKHPQKIIICGVCKNVEPFVANTIYNMEKLGGLFTDYVVIIYENNSTDNTVSLFREWVKKNPHVIFLSENMHDLDLPLTRTERIARARNKVLDVAKNPKFKEFEFLVMADLDFRSLWPIEEIVKMVSLNREWDCIAANGVVKNAIYYDRFAFRDRTYPFGPEVIDGFWAELSSPDSWFKLTGDELIPVFSAFGGLAIYKMASIRDCGYSGIVTDDLKSYYQEILASLPETNKHVQKYLQQNNISSITQTVSNPIIFRYDDLPKYGYHCCEHLPFHASMAVKGFGNFFINPKMYMGEITLSEERSSSAPYLSGDTFRAYADFIIDETHVPFYPEKVARGNTIFVKTDYLESFLAQYHSLIAEPYILITHNSDFAAPGRFGYMLEDPKIIAWFAQNVESLSHPKLHPIPIGIANRSWKHGDVAVIEKIRNILSVFSKNHLLYMNFVVQNFPEERSLVYNQFIQKTFCFTSMDKSFEEYLVDVAQSCFVLSPRGNGIDCHRTWEALYLGAIPIVRTSSLDHLFEGLPVLIVKDWSEVTESYLKERYIEMQSRHYSWEKLEASYWFSLIDAFKNQ